MPPIDDAGDDPVLNQDADPGTGAAADLQSGADAPGAGAGAGDAGGKDGAGDGAPSSMLDAITSGLDAATKAEKDPAAAAADAAAAKGDAGKADAARSPVPGKDGAAGKPPGDLEEIYRIPEGLNGAARASFKRLSDHAIELRGQFEQVQTAATADRETLAGFQEVIRDSGATPPQMAAMFDYLALVNAGQIDKALDLLESERTELARRSGKAVPGVDLLEGFADLKADVDGFKVTRERAEEIAKFRRAEAEAARARDAGGRERALQTEQAKHNEAKQNALQDVKTWITDKRKTDLDFAAKDVQISAKLGEILKGVPPALWLHQITLYYDALAAAPSRPSSKDPQPLRPRSGGGGKAQPRSMAEAISQGLGYEQAG